MALETQFPFFSPLQLRPQPHRPVTEIRFSRWDNANARKFNLRQRTQKELEDRIRFEKRFDAAIAISHNYNPAPPHPVTHKSTGTPSAPSSPSIPGKASKYSKPPDSSPVHPAFKPFLRSRKLPPTEHGKGNETSPQANFRIDESGVSYELPGAPFVYQYSYTETPKVKPVKLREPLVSPFGPTTMPKPWMGKKPMAKKALPELDSFKLPPQKKGVKPVQAPGPFLPDSGPKYVISREEIIGEPLTKEEIFELIHSCKKSRRQLNMGRDGLTHNMLENIHALWKRRRVCKIKCIGVCTVDMDNICEQLEEKTGGKIIFNRGGVIYLFRGRNYNHKTRPRFPLMLWKPAAPVYPRLVKHVPEGLTLDEAREMRTKGRELTPICKLAKNGLYSNLVRHVREAFEACELVRINCEGLNPSDFKKIGAKLQDLVPCVLISFEREHILMWRGREWKSSIEHSPIRNESSQAKVDSLASTPSPSPVISADSLGTKSYPSGSLGDSAAYEPAMVGMNSNAIETASSPDESSHIKTHSTAPEMSPVVTLSDLQETENGHQESLLDSELVDLETEVVGDETFSQIFDDARINGSRGSMVPPYDAINETTESKIAFSEDSVARLADSEFQEILTHSPSPVKAESLVSNRCVDGILLLRKQAIENGMAIVFQNHRLDADFILKEAVAFDKTAPPGPIFEMQPKNNSSQKNKVQDSGDSEPKQPETVASTGAITLSGKRDSRRKTSKTRRLEFVQAEHLGATPHGSLRVDELARLLA